MNLLKKSYKNTRILSWVDVVFEDDKYDKNKKFIDK
jgi:hypothetical protein